MGTFLFQSMKLNTMTAPVQNQQNNQLPPVRFELTTPGLRDQCSTTELKGPLHITKVGLSLKIDPGKKERKQQHKIKDSYDSQDRFGIELPRF